MLECLSAILLTLLIVQCALSVSLHSETAIAESRSLHSHATIMLISSSQHRRIECDKRPAGKKVGCVGGPRAHKPFLSSLKFAGRSPTVMAAVHLRDKSHATTGVISDKSSPTASAECQSVQLPWEVVALSISFCVL